MIKYICDRRCTDCTNKKECSTFKDVKEEKTPSGWDLNRFAIYCREYKESEGTNGRTTIL